MSFKKSSLSSLRARNELVSLSERLIYLFILRAAFVVMVPVAAMFSTAVAMPSKIELLLIGGAYFGLVLGIEFARRWLGMRAIFLIGVTLLIDGVFLGWVTYATGGAESPVRFLIYLHLIAVTLLASYRTGLKVALWHSLLLFVAFYAQLADILEPLTLPNLPPKEAASAFHRASVFNVLAFWLVAICTTTFSSLNERELRRRHIDLQALAEMASELEDATEPAAIAETFLDKVMTTFEFKRGAVVAGRIGDLALLAERGGTGVSLDPEAMDAVIGRAWDEHDAVLLKRFDAKNDPFFNALLPGARNIVAAPLFAEGRPLGVVVLEKPVVVGNRVERRVISMVMQFSAHAALALRNGWLLGQVKRLAETDPLTGVANRRTFETRLRTEVERSRRSGEQISLLMLDIDRFKALNDTHGHVVGDDVLRRVAELLQSQCRSFDQVARYGGEEFAMILPMCSANDSVGIADRIRRAMMEIEGDVSITVSIGAATLPMNAADDDDLVRAADEALYESKRAGRNRVSRSRRKGRRMSSVTSSDEDAPEQLTL